MSGKLVKFYISKDWVSYGYRLTVLVESFKCFKKNHYGYLEEIEFPKLEYSWVVKEEVLYGHFSFHGNSGIKDFIHHVIYNQPDIKKRAHASPTFYHQLMEGLELVVGEGEHSLLIASTPAKQDQSSQIAVFKAIPALKGATKCPVGKRQTPQGVRVCFDNSIWEMIQHVNDIHKWSREQIADWLETLDADLRFDNECEEED